MRRHQPEHWADSISKHHAGPSVWVILPFLSICDLLCKYCVLSAVRVDLLFEYYILCVSVDDIRCVHCVLSASIEDKYVWGLSTYNVSSVKIQGEYRQPSVIFPVISVNINDLRESWNWRPKVRTTYIAPWSESVYYLLSISKGLSINGFNELLITFN